MGSTELGVGILLVCVSVAVAAVWGSDRDEEPGAARAPTAQHGSAPDASAASVADNSVAP